MDIIEISRALADLGIDGEICSENHISVDVGDVEVDVINDPLLGRATLYVGGNSYNFYSISEMEEVINQSRKI